MRNPRGLRAHSRNSSASPVDLELSVLRELCHARLTRPVWEKIAREFQGYAWQDMEHGLVYAAIQRLASRGPGVLREHLPAQATRMGFPDIDWKAYLPLEGKRSPAPTTGQIVRLIRALRRPRDAEPVSLREPADIAPRRNEDR